MTRPFDQIIGREHIDDLEEILALVNTDTESTSHTTGDPSDADFTWDYRKGTRPTLARLYELAKRSQWNAETDLPWHLEVDQERVVLANAAANQGFGDAVDLTGTAFERWDEKQWVRFGIESQNWTMSQFLHGEQGALLCTAKLVEAVPWIDAKYFAAMQVADEARHVEAFSKYLDKLSGRYPINAHLRLLLDDVIGDSRWDLTYLGMQIMVEGLALAAFGFIRQYTTEPLLKELLRYVMADEARHVAFGVVSLTEVYDGLTAAEIRERQEFAFEAAVRLRDRFLHQEVWERLDVDARQATRLILQSPERRLFQQLLFAKIVPNCRKLGLLDAGDGWLRERFTELGVIAFEHGDDGSGGDEGVAAALAGEALRVPG